MLYNLHTHCSTQQANVIEVVNQYPNNINQDDKYFSLGIHPWHIDLNTIDADLVIIKNNCIKTNMLAIGECGLDKRIQTPIEVQQMVFEKQLLIAVKYDKPLILHCVAAYQEVIEIKKKLDIKVPLIIHGFSKNWQTAKSLLDNGFYLSFGKYLLQNPEMAIVFKKTPNNMFFLETDTIQNDITEVYKKATEIKNINIEQQVATNFYYVFKQK